MRTRSPFWNGFGYIRIGEMTKDAPVDLAEARARLQEFAKHYSNPHGLSAFALCELFEQLDAALSSPRAPDTQAAIVEKEEWENRS